MLPMKNISLEKLYEVHEYEDLDYLKSCKDAFKQELLNELLKHVKIIESYSKNGNYNIKCEFDIFE